jgi:hypothetical protein
VKLIRGEEEKRNRKIHQKKRYTKRINGKFKHKSESLTNE